MTGVAHHQARSEEAESGALTGVAVHTNGNGYLYYTPSTGHKRVCIETPFQPYLWAQRVPPHLGKDYHVEERTGAGALNVLIKSPDIASHEKLASYLKKEKISFENVTPYEHQTLMANGLRMFAGMRFGDLRRCQLDIETKIPEDGRFPNPRHASNRVLSIGLRVNRQNTLLHLEEDTDEAEQSLLKRFHSWLDEQDPDTIEGHNIHHFDLDYLHARCQRYKLPCPWGRDGATARFRRSRLRVAERSMDYMRCDIPGRTVVDTYFLSMMYDITAREMDSYGLKAVARHFGISTEETRTYLKPERIQHCFFEDRDTFESYLIDDLVETEGIADILLPTYVAQAQNFAMTLQEILLRGTGSKIENLFLEQYYHAGAALPEAERIRHYEGGFTKSFQTGVFQHILHYDVASLYPSLLLLIGRNPKNDDQGVFISMLDKLRSYRLKYKQKARSETDPELKREYDARQASYKIIINSFYGYLGFDSARFADGTLAAEVTERGRDLLKQLIDQFEALGCTVLEADTDGLYLSSETYFNEPEQLLEKAKTILPEGIDLEWAGRYESMFCYKAKNYALYDGENVTIRGSALRSRGTEPYLKQLTQSLIHYLLGASQTHPLQKLEQMRSEIQQGEMPVEQLARKEYLSQSPQNYRESVEKQGKSRRASLEAASLLERPVQSGDRMAYYITYGEKKRMADWQLARPLEQYDPESQPYNVDHYLKKLNEWEKRYRDYLSDPERGSTEQMTL